MAQGMRNRGASIALATTVLVHAGIAWWLLGLREAPPAPARSIILEVAWIDRPPPPSEVGAPAPRMPARAVRVRSLPPPSAPRPLQAVDVAAPAIEGDLPAPGSATLLDQAAEWARAQAPADGFAHDPLRHRPPPRRDGSFAMREPISTEDVVIAVGKLFGGGPSDPCPRIRRNLANLGTGGDAELRSEEIRRLQQFCL